MYQVIAGVWIASHYLRPWAELVSLTRGSIRVFLWQLPQRLESMSSDRSGNQGSFPERPEGLADWSSRKAINLKSPGFANMRAAGAPFVDKTSAIADLLCGRPPRTRRAFFSRPRKFGKVRL